MGDTWEGFESNLVEKLSFSHLLVFYLQSINQAYSIDVDLNTPDQCTRILLDYDKNQVVRKIKKENDWTNEETKENMESEAVALPKPGEMVKLVIYCDEDRYRIWLQDKPFCQYSYFIPPDKVIVAKAGNTGLQRVTKFDHRKLFPSPWPLFQNDWDPQHFSHEIPVTFNPNDLLTITGITQGDEKGYLALYFYDGLSGHRLLHFAPYFNEKFIYRTAAQGACGWEPNLTDGPFPFKFGEKFKIAITFMKDRFIFGVNGTRLPDFKYQELSPLTHCTGFKMQGNDGLDVIVSKVEHHHFTKEDCIDFNFEEILCDKEKQNLPATTYARDSGDSELDCSEVDEFENSSESLVN